MSHHKINNKIAVIIFGVLLTAVYAAHGQSTGPVKTADPVPKIVSSGVINGKAVTLIKPEYPAAAVSAGISGAVNVQVTIDESGNVISARATSGPDLLRSGAEVAALQSKFKPTTLAGEPVKVSGIIVYNFEPPNRAHQIRGVLLGAVLNAPEILDFVEKDGSMDSTFGAEIAKEFPLLSKEVEPLNSLSGLSAEELAKIFAQVAVKVEAKLTGDDAWQFSLGKRLAGIVNETAKRAKNETYKIDESIFRAELLSIRELLKTVPEAFSRSMLKKFKELSDLGDKENLTSNENLSLIFAKFDEIFSDGPK